MKHATAAQRIIISLILATVGCFFAYLVSLGSVLCSPAQCAWPL